MSYILERQYLRLHHLCQQFRAYFFIPVKNHLSDVQRFHLNFFLQMADVMNWFIVYTYICILKVFHKKACRCHRNLFTAFNSNKNSLKVQLYCVKGFFPPQLVNTQNTK